MTNDYTSNSLIFLLGIFSDVGLFVVCFINIVCFQSVTVPHPSNVGGGVMGWYCSTSVRYDDTDQ